MSEDATPFRGHGGHPDEHVPNVDFPSFAECLDCDFECVRLDAGEDWLGNVCPCCAYQLGRQSVIDEDAPPGFRGDSGE